MIFQQARIGDCTQRRPPQLRPESFLMNSIHQSLHIGVAVGKFLGIEQPIPIIILPAVIQSDPGEAQLLRGWKRVIYLLELNLTAITPSTPDRPNSALR